jgi:SAM-dependent methyltransferase
MNEVAAYTRLAGVYDEIVVDPCYPRWAEFLDGLWGRADFEVHTVLDVCCGTGLMASELVDRGYRVFGVDAAPAMLERARARLGPDAPLRLSVLPDLGTDLIFDAAISTFDGLNYLTVDDFRRSIGAIGARLRPGGWLIFDLHTDAMLNFTVANPVVTGESAGNQFLIRSAVDPTTRSCATTIEITQVDGGEPFTEQHHQFFHSEEQVTADLIAAGFTDVRSTDEYTHDPTDHETLRATWIARYRPS